MYLVIQLTWETGRLSLQKPGPEKTECILKDKFWNSNLQDPGVPGIDNNFIRLDLASPGYTSLGVNILRASVANFSCGVSFIYSQILDILSFIRCLVSFYISDESVFSVPKKWITFLFLANLFENFTVKLHAKLLSQRLRW